MWSFAILRLQLVVLELELVWGQEWELELEWEQELVQVLEPVLELEQEQVLELHRPLMR
jgi:hypothetical protein